MDLSCLISYNGREETARVRVAMCLYSADVWIQFAVLVKNLVASLVSEATSRFIVELSLPRYVMVGGSALLQCEYNVPLDQLHRVEWLRNGKKIFQFVKGRTPPFRNYSIPGAELDVSSDDALGLPTGCHRLTTHA